ncbi:MAG: helix-turn-helix domain-containing protein [Bacteroidaceae bacterium]|nr:helix-turn-helix domain-containing protein [Bacteroidaceae bacterium]
MRRRNVFGIGFLITLAVSIVHVEHLWNIHCKQIASWNITAAEFFKVAVFEEMPDGSLSYAVSVGETSGSYKVYLPDSIKALLAPKQRYVVPKAKVEKNLSPNRIITQPFSAERIYYLWDSLLNIRHIPLNLQVRSSYTDIQDNTLVSCAPDKGYFKHVLDTIYAGYRSEAEIIGYVDYPGWWNGIRIWNWLLLFLPWTCFGCFAVNYDKLISFYHIKLQKKVIVEKKIHLADVQIEKAQIYRLPDGMLFDTFAGTLVKDDLNCTISPQSANLLKLFLRNANNRVSAEEIDTMLWGGKGTKEQLQNAISRLRKTLRTVDSSMTIQNVGGVFELKGPISSKNTDSDMNR